MTAIKLASIFADRLDLNGDQANLFVLNQRMKWSGIQCEIISIESAQQLEKSQANFLLLGHGSSAAWNSCLTEWPQLAQDFLNFCSNSPGIAVGTGADLAASAAGFTLGMLQTQFSEFCVEDFEQLPMLGYKNTRTTPNQTVRAGKAILTWLHGPVLAKNPLLADSLIALVLGRHFDSENENTRKIDEILAGVWQLEAPKN